MNRIVRVDLSSGRIDSLEIPQEWRRRYLGARGLNMYILFSLIPPPIDPLSPQNPLIFGCGLLTGMPGFGTGRFNISAFSPASGNVGDSNCGGHFGPELKFAGWDHLIVTGRSPEPVYIFIHNDKITVRSAGHLWGKNTWETQQAIREELGDPRVRVATIGPAGENLVRMANIITGYKDAAGRFGMGAVMGSKNLKAVAVRGTQDIRPAFPKELLALLKEQDTTLLNRKWIKSLARYGTPLLVAPANEGGWLLTRNDRGEPLGERGRAIYAESLDRYSLGMASCFGCAVHCRHRHLIKEGPRATRGEGPEYSIFAWMGANLEILDVESIIYASDRLNLLGMDIMDTFVMVAFAMELYEKGIISEKETGRALHWGDIDAVLDLIEKMARREGFGDILADGAFSLERLPREASPCLLRIRNALVGGPGGRVVKSFGMAHAVASLPGHLHRNRPGVDVLGLPREVLEKLYGGPVSSDYRSYEGKARMVWWHELLYAVCDSLGFCRFQTVFNSPHSPQYDEYAQLIRLALGWDITPEELKEIGERIYTTERLLLGKLGIGTRKDDTLPARWFDEPVPGGPCKGEVIDRQEFQKFLDEYYQLHGWDDEGKPTKETVTRLGILESEELRKLCRPEEK